MWVPGPLIPMARGELLRGSSAACQVGQVLLRLQYQERRQRPEDLPALSDVEFRCYSQNGEDGILLYIFSVLGITDRRVVEVGAGDGIECNAANLIVNHGWRGRLIDVDPWQLASGRAFYALCPHTRISPPTLVAAWITSTNVNRLVLHHGVAGPIDLLSLDVDGNDYWIWRALDCVEPRVVVLEFNALCGPEQSVTIPCRDDFRRDLARPYYFGASLAAFVTLGREKGYHLVGVQSLGFNAFFVRAGVGEDLLPERSPRECFRAQRTTVPVGPGVVRRDHRERAAMAGNLTPSTA